MTTRLSAIAALGLVGACSGRAPAPTAAPTSYRYDITFQHEVTEQETKQVFTIGDVDVDGAILVVDGVVAGRLVDGSDGPTVNAAVAAASTFFDHAVHLALRFPSPCGPATEVELVDYETNLPSLEAEQAKRATGRFQVLVKLGPSVVTPSGNVTVWVDDTSRPDAVVTFGAATISRDQEIWVYDQHDRVPGRRANLWDVGCGPRHVVTIDGTQVGVAESRGKDASAYLISTDPSACYQKEIRHYASRFEGITGPGSSVFPVAPGQVTPIKWQDISYFVRPAPQALPGDYSTDRSVVARVDCATAAAARHRR